MKVFILICLTVYSFHKTVILHFYFLLNTELNDESFILVMSDYLKALLNLLK